MTSPSGPDGGDAAAGAAPDPVTERLPTSSSSSSSSSAAERAQAIAVLDEPLDDKDLGEQIRRPGLSRSTRVLLLLLAAVVVFALGALLGRATAPDTGPGSSPDVTGTVESVGTGGSPITVRTADGQLVVLGTTPGTSVGTPQPGGPGGLRAGERVVVGAERNLRGGLDATHVDVTGR